MRKNINRFLTLIFSFLIYYPTLVLADSGLESNYESSDSLIGGIINAVMSSFSFLIKLFSEKPGSEDYPTSHIIVSILCIIILYTVFAVYQFKLDNKKEKKAIIKLGISLIPTVLFALLCFLTKFYLIIYSLILTVIIVTYIIIMKVKIKRRFNNEKAKLLEIDKEFDEEQFNLDVFNVYRDIQLAWSSFNLDKVKNNISEDLYEDYSKKLEELKSKNQKNIMDNIEYKSNEIKDIIVNNKEATITCEIEVICNDYIINNEDKVIKGKIDKKYNYKYRLIINKKDNNLILVKKKLLNTSIK